MTCGLTIQLKMSDITPKPCDIIVKKPVHSRKSPCKCAHSVIYQEIERSFAQAGKCISLITHMSDLIS